MACSLDGRAALPDVVRFTADVIVTDEELASFDTPERLRDMIDAKMLNLRHVMARYLRETLHREVAL